MAKSSAEARVLHLPLDACKLYPGIPIRFDMGIERLGESIHKHGQQEPGMAIQQGDRYLVLDGRRRLLACKYAKYYYGGPTIYWATVHKELDEVQIFTIAFIKNDERKSFSFLEEVNYFREANKKFGAKVAAEIGLSAGREKDYMKRVLEVGNWIDGKLVKLRKIEMFTAHRFRLSDLEALAAFRSDDAMFFQAATAVAAARLMNPAEADPNEIKALVKYYATWFSEVFPEFSNVLQPTIISTLMADPGQSKIGGD